MATSFDGLGGAQSLGKSTLKSSVTDHLRRLIFSGQLRPGQRIDQEELAAKLGVSKLPVREALITLESESLVRIIPRRGTYVASLTPDDIRDSYHIYGAVLGIAAARASDLLSQEELEELGGLLDQLEGSESLDDQEQLNFEFHRRINVAGGSRRLQSVIRLLANTLPGGFYEFATGWADIAHSEHRRILKALMNGDAEGAGRAMVDHMLSGGEYAVSMLEQSNFWSDEPEQAE